MQEMDGFQKVRQNIRALGGRPIEISAEDIAAFVKQNFSINVKSLNFDPTIWTEKSRVRKAKQIVRHLQTLGR